VARSHVRWRDGISKIVTPVDTGRKIASPRCDDLSAARDSILTVAIEGWAQARRTALGDADHASERLVAEHLVERPKR